MYGRQSEGVGCDKVRQNVVGNSGDPLIEGIWASASSTGGMLHPDHCCGRASLGGMVGVGYESPTR